MSGWVGGSYNSSVSTNATAGGGNKDDKRLLHWATTTSSTTTINNNNNNMNENMTAKHKYMRAKIPQNY